MSEPRAIIFDLDDTLYPREWFVRSGFLTVSRLVETEYGVPRECAMRTLQRARGSRPGREFQALCARFELPEAIVPDLVKAVRAHRPAIRLPISSATVLRRLRPDWRIAVLTNGTPAVQRRKIKALNLNAYVDVVLCAEEYADGGKPKPAAFRAAADRLATPAARTVFVGDDPMADMAGARRVGLRTIHLSRSSDGWPAALPPPDARVPSIRFVPRVAEQLLTSGRAQHHVA
jgi:putative hydrolase of the HAD superfamily